MKKIAKILSVFLVALTFFSVCAIAASAENFQFNDVSKDDEYLYDAVQLLHSLEIAKGQTKTTYGVSKYVTREQMATFIYRLMKEGRSVEYGENLTPFTDLEDDYYFGMISWANYEGIIKGVTETEFNPYGKITLQDCYVMIARAFGYEKDGPLGYPHEYIDIAERIGLNTNINSKLEYTDSLTRGDVAIILFNAFNAEINETTTKYDWVENEATGKAQYVPFKKPLTLCEKVFGISVIERRIAATPNFGLNLEEIPPALSNSAEYTVYEPTYDELSDGEYIRTAAIIPKNESNTIKERVEGEESLIKFSDLKLKGKADDYFLKDIVIYLKKDGKIVSARTQGTHVVNASAHAEERSGTNLKRDYNDSSKAGVTNEKDIRDSGKIKTGMVTMGEAKAYFYNRPSSVSNYAWSIYPYDDGEGRWTFKAGIMWNGERHHDFHHIGVEPAYKTFEQNPENFMNYQRANWSYLSRILSISKTDGSVYDLEYYDCNEDGIVDYFWMKPFTFGKVVDSRVDTNKTTAKHTGESANRAYFNTQTHFPEIHINGAKVEGGSYKDGQAVFAYVSGPANYVKIASDDINNSIKHSITTPTTLVSSKDSLNNNSKWENGLNIYAWNSADMIVGHVKWSDGKSYPTGLISLETDVDGNLNGDNGPNGKYLDNFSANWRKSLAMGQYWELYTKDSRVCWARKVSQPVDLAKNYAIIQYLDEEEDIVAWDAGYIDYDSTLVNEGLHVRAYIDGQYQFVPLAKKVGDVVQDNQYFLDNELVNEVSTYTVDKNGRYIFKPFNFDTASSKAEDLAGKDDTLTYNVRVTDSISLSKYRDNLYKFVPGVGYDGITPALKPNGMSYVNVDKDTLVIIKFVNEDGDNDFAIYNGDNLPAFDTTDDGMAFTSSYVVLQNNPDTTITERLAFMYCVVGGEIMSESTSQDAMAVIMGKIQKSEADKDTYYEYETYDIMTGNYLGKRTTYKETESALEDFMIYELTEDGYIKNNAAGKVASLKSDSSDLVKVDSYYDDDNLLFLEGGTNVLVDHNTKYVLVDRDQLTITADIDGEEILGMSAEDDVDNVYFNEGAEKLTALILSEEKVDDLDLAYLIVIVRG